MRDYGTGAWEGGDAECDHRKKDPEVAARKSTLGPNGDGLGPGNQAHNVGSQFGDVCGKCGATRIDQQLGLEPTPEEFVAKMVEVFREVRRVLAPHGTVWLNLGDSYASQPPGNTVSRDERPRSEKFNAMGAAASADRMTRKASTVAPGLKQKDLVGIPWRVAFALQADGWYLRSDIIWAKPNPMPESVTDRPTKAHEYVFLLSKQPRYFFDSEAVREKAEYGYRPTKNGNIYDRVGDSGKSPEKTPGVITHGGDPSTGRNIRSVWEIATQPYPEAHFATFPEELARRCIAAGCPEQVCRVCGKARERITQKETTPTQRVHNGVYDASSGFGKSGWLPGVQSVETLGFTDCGHSDYRPGLTLDPFIGSGTVAHVARKLGRHAVGIDLNESYLELAARRLQQQSLFASESV